MQSLKFLLFLIILPFISNAQQTDSTKGNQFTLYSPAFENNSFYPKLYTCDSSAISPPLAWKNIPSGTKSFAVTMHHFPKTGNMHVYMVLYNIPAGKSMISQAEKTSGIWGHNSLNKILGYAPPCSQGPGEKSYIINIYAISKVIHSQNADLSMDELLKEIDGKTLATSTLTLKYKR